MDLLAFEQKLDSTIMRKRLEIQETLKKPMKLKRKLRVFISHQFLPGDPEMPPSTSTAASVRGSGCLCIGCGVCVVCGMCVCAHM